MDKRDKIDAGKALANWFETQELGVDDATEVMAYLMAEILIIKSQHEKRKPIHEQLAWATDLLFSAVQDRQAKHAIAQRRKGR